METIKQRALRMACDTFLSDYEGTPSLHDFDLFIGNAMVWEPFEGYGIGTLQHVIRQQAHNNEQDLRAALDEPLQLLLAARNALEGFDMTREEDLETLARINAFLGKRSF